MKSNVKDGTPIKTKGEHHNYRKEFEKAFKELAQTHNSWQIWQDFVTLSALSISNAVDKRKEVWQKREDEYMNIVKRYSKKELDLFPQLLGYTTMALDVNPCQDFLGQLYMDLDFGRGWRGQFFTPWSVAEMMAMMQIDENAVLEVSDDGYFSVADPCCGAGVMLLAFAHVCKENYGLNYQHSVLFVGQDIDPIVAKMCYIQMSLLGLPGYVVVGDSLSKPVLGSELNPIHNAEDIWYTPMFYSTVWCFRRMINGDVSIGQCYTSRKNSKTSTEAFLFEDAVENPKPKKINRISSSKEDISLAKQELSKLEQQKASLRRAFKRGKEKLQDEIKNKSENNK